VSQERKHKSSKDIVAAARKVLRLSEDATWEDVRDAYRAMAAEHHPDKQRSAAGRAKAEKRMKEINAAYATLKLHFEQAA
jgi:DnaJ-class molecular chaperone